MNEISKSGALVVILAHLVGYFLLRHYLPIVSGRAADHSDDSSTLFVGVLFGTAFGVTAISKLFEPKLDWTPAVWRAVLVFGGLAIAEALFLNLNLSWG